MSLEQLEPTDFVQWTDIPLADAVERALFYEIVRAFDDEKFRHGRGTKGSYIVEDKFAQNKKDFWLYYDASRRVFLDADRCVFSSSSNLYQSGPVREKPGPGYWHWVAHHAFIYLMGVLAQALEDGVVGIAGQREPVTQVDQEPENLPYSAFDNRFWRLYREKSIVEIADATGRVQNRFRRCQLIDLSQPRSSKPAHPPHNESDNLSSRVRDDERLLEEIREVIGKKFNVHERGSRWIAEQIMQLYPDKNYRKGLLIEIVTEMRGGPLPVGRPAGTRKR